MYRNLENFQYFWNQWVLCLDCYTYRTPNELRDLSPLAEILFLWENLRLLFSFSLLLSYVQSVGAMYFETSAKNNIGVEDVFLSLTNMVSVLTSSNWTESRWNFIHFLFLFYFPFRWFKRMTQRTKKMH